MTVNKTGNTTPGLLFIAPFGNGTLASGPEIMTENNDLVWQGPTGSATNLRVQQLNGEDVLTYWEGVNTATFGTGHGTVHILDNTYTEIANVCLSDFNVVAPNNQSFPCQLDMHESYLTDKGTLVATVYNTTQYDLTPVGGPENGWVFDTLFLEIDIHTEEVLFQWSALDHIKDIPLTDSHYPLTLFNISLGVDPTYPWDYFHINSVQPLDDGGYLLNGRHLWTVFKLDSKGDIEWRIQGVNGGDFTLDSGIHFTWEHNPRIVSSSGNKYRLTMFDNDNFEGDMSQVNPTYALDLTVDTDAMHVSLNEKLSPGDPVYVKSMGSNQVLPNGNYFIGYGQEAYMNEFDSNGNVVYFAQFGASTVDEMVNSYRNYRYNWTATPAADPKIAVDNSDGQTNVYVSWNGATEVQRWSFMGGSTEHDMKSINVVDKMGFETKSSVPSDIKFVMAEALTAGQDPGSAGTAKTKVISTS